MTFNPYPSLDINNHPMIAWRGLYFSPYQIAKGDQWDECLVELGFPCRMVMPYWDDFSRTIDEIETAQIETDNMFPWSSFMRKSSPRLSFSDVNHVYARTQADLCFIRLVMGK